MLMLFVVPTAYAQQWDKLTKKAFRKVKVYNLEVDMSKAKFAKLDSSEFVAYYCGREGRDKGFLGAVLKKIRYVLEERLEKSYGR